MTILITGANRGIGKAIFDAYMANGQDVVGTHRAPDTGKMRSLDVTDPKAQERLADSLDDVSVDLLVCNAGVFLDRGQNLEDGYPAEQWADTFAANVTSVFLTVQSFLPHLKRSAHPKIAIISSQMGSDTRAPGGSYIYRSSKAAALNLGRNLAKDLAPRGIAVGIYHPGWVQTDMGGEAADITVEESATGLIARFEALSLDTTGCFETWDGRPHAY